MERNASQATRAKDRTTIILSPMHEYIALIGHQPALSLAELGATLADLAILDAGSKPGVVRFRSKTVIDQAWLDRIGGTILIARRITDDAIDLDDVPSLLATEVQGAKGKVTFALRCIGVGGRHAESLGMTCKKHLKSLGIISRFVGSATNPAKAIQLHDEGLLQPPTGAEIVLMADANGLWAGKTVAAQNVKLYTTRDIAKPVRDTTVGLLPPKLAQVLINFGRFLCASSGAKPSTLSRVLDPFCGTGVIPLEAMVQSIDVLASDIAAKAISGTETNIEWARKTWKILKKDVATTVWKQDATKPFDLKETPSVVVTEGSLGPALKSRPTVKDAERYARDAASLTERFLRNIATSLPGVPVVMTLPCWYAQKRPIPVPDIDALVQGSGYTPVLPPFASPFSPGRTSLLYRRPDQFVGREILLLQPRTSPRDVE